MNITAQILREAFQQIQREILANQTAHETRWERMAEVLNGKMQQEEMCDQWKIIPDDSSKAHVTFKLESYNLKVSVKWDGCSHFWFDDEECYHHICALDEFVQAMQALNKLALRYFGGEYSVGLLREDQVRQKIAEIRNGCK